jgi:hypothetical protein
MMLAAQVHVGSKNADASMARYIYKRRSDGAHVPLRGPCAVPTAGVRFPHGATPCVFARAVQPRGSVVVKPWMGL